MVLGTSLGWPNTQTIVAAVILAFIFGYALTMLPLVRAGMALGSVLNLAFAAEVGLDRLLFWDSLAGALVVAGVLGVDEVVAEVLPDGKVAAIQALQARYGRVAFAGDGVNDAPALATADAGIAKGAGTDIAIGSADLVLMRSDLLGVTTAIALSRAVLGNNRQNLIWAFGYNVDLIPVAAGLLYPTFGILLSPMIAAGAMARSTASRLKASGNTRRVPLI